MAKVLFIPHGGGPLPLIGDPAHAPLVTALTGLRPILDGAKAIIVVTAHWEAETPSFSSSAAPGMLYDYFGFPEETYRLNYPAPGAPELAARAAQALGADGFATRLDPERGFDHGTFVPLMLMRPEADIPVLQMSLLASLDPARHIAGAWSPAGRWRGAAGFRLQLPQHAGAGRSIVATTAHRGPAPGR